MAGSMRKIPATMVTQHPDHASKPYWHTTAYVGTQYEAEEAFRSFSELGAQEYKWDWEGKLVDESVLERLFAEYFDYFKKHPLGKDSFLTFRLPNPKVETEFRVGRAFINIMSGNSLASHFDLHIPPLREVILPMTESAGEIIAIQDAYAQIRHLDHPLYRQPKNIPLLEVIPLFEQVTTIIRSDGILRKYFQLYKKRFHTYPGYFRPYIARSDPALNSGIIPTILATKIVLSKYKKLSNQIHIPFYSIIGAGSLPFRGGISPDTVDDFLNEYRGIRTTTLQSAFRYDYPLKDVKKAITKLNKQLPLKEAKTISAKEEKELVSIIIYAEKQYKYLVEPIAPFINTVAKSIPRRRERFLHVGLFGYSRGDGKVKLPRAIGFTCALYSVGIPPEFIGTGKAIQFAQKIKKIGLLEKYYMNIRKDLLRAGKFVNKSNLKVLAKQTPVWEEILENVEIAEKYADVTFTPSSVEEKKHYHLTRKILKGIQTGTNVSRAITKTGLLRHSMG